MMTGRINPATRALLAILLAALLTLSSTPVITLDYDTETQDSPFNGAASIDDTLLEDISANRQVDVLVKYDAGIGETKAWNAILKADEFAEFVEVFEELSLIRTRMMAGALTGLSRDTSIVSVWSNEVNQVETQSVPSAHQSQGYESVVDVLGVRDLWAQGYNGSGIVIAVLDTGIDFLHADLDDFDDNRSTVDSKVTAFASFVEADTLPVDIIGHGTYAASIAAGTGEQSDGAYAGVAPGATLLAAKVTLGGILAAPSWIVSGIEWACSRGADIILMPFNTLGAPGDAVAQAIELATQKGILVVAAAGDDGPDYLTIMSPGGSTRALTVGAYDNVKHEVPLFSGRGPSFELMAKPDLVTLGVGVVGAKAGAGLASAGFAGLDLTGLGSLSGLIGGSLGESIDDNYIVADTTAGSAAIVAGVAAIMLQAFDRATPIAVSNAFRDTALELPYGANDAGAGLLDVDAAFHYLSHQQAPGEAHIRTTGTPLLALGMISSQGANANTTMLMSSFGTMTAAIDQRGTEDSGLHLLLGMFSLKWNNMDPTNLMMFNVKRELHQVYTGQNIDNYNRYVGVLSYESTVYVAILVETYGSNNPLSVPPSTGLKITPFVINLGNNTLENVTLYLSYSLDIYADGNEDHGKYALSNQMLFAYGLSDELGDFYFGVNSSRSLTAFEVGNSSDISSHVSNDNLTGSTSFDGRVGLGMKWSLESLASMEQTNMTISVGFAENRTVLNDIIDTLWQLGPSAQMQQYGDLIVLEADIPRIAGAGVEYTSRAVVMNVGVEPSPIVAALLIARTEADGGAIYASYSTYDSVEPFRARVVTAKWRPEANAVYSAAWVVASGIEQALALFSDPTGTIAAIGLGLLDDFLNRDLFVIEPITSVSVFPRQLPFAPFDLRFPADFGMFGLTLYTTVPLGNLTVTSRGNASEWGNMTLTAAENVEGYYNFTLLLFVPAITMDGYHQCIYEIQTASGYSTEISLEKELEYPRAMILLDTSHGNGIFGAATGLGDFGGIGGSTNMSISLAQETSGSDTSSMLEGFDLTSLGSLSDMMESLRLTTFSGLSEMKRVMADSGLDLIEIPGGGLDKNILTQFSGVVIIRPTEEYNSSDIETLRDFTNSGGRLVILGDQNDKANLTALNPLLNAYGYEMKGEHSTDNTTEIVTSSKLGTGLQRVWLGGGTYIYNNQSNAAVLLNGLPVVLLDETPPKIALFGSSSIFMNKNLPKCDNLLLLGNLNLFFLENTVSTATALSENTTLYPAGRSVYLNLWLTDFNGNPVNGVFVAIAFELPNGSFSYFYAAFVDDGLYSSQFMPMYYSDVGRINGIFIIIRNEEYAGTFASISFTFYVPEQPTTTGGVDRLLTLAQVALISALSIFGMVTGGLMWNKRKQGKRLRVPEVDLPLTQAIDNTMNRFLAAFVQIEGVIKSEELDRIQKIESVRAMMNLLEEAKKDFQKLSKKVGGV